jgi:transcriptional regulator with XRE-family HTH domain
MVIMAKKRPKKLSEQIRHAIETCGKTRYQIAKETGVDAATLCRFVKGRHGLSLDTLDRVAECIGMEIIVRDEARKQKG